MRSLKLQDGTFAPQALIVTIYMMIKDLLARPDEQTRAKRQALSAFVIRVLSAGFAYLSQIFLARLLGQFEYGIFAYVWIWVIIVGHITCFGFNESVIRFVPRYLQRGQLERLAGYLHFSQLATFFASLMIAIAGMALLYLFEDVVTDHYVLPLFLAAICVPLFALTDMQEGVARGFDWVGTALIPPYLLRPVLLILGVAAALWWGAPATATTALAVAIVTTFLTLLVQMAMVRRQIADETPLPSQRRYSPALWLRAALPLILVDSFDLLQTYADLFVLNLYVPPDQLAIYFATARTVALVSFIHFAVSATALQKFSAYQASGAKDKLHSFAHATTRWTFWPALAATALILVLGYPLLWMFGGNFTAGYPLMFILALGFVLHATSGQAEFLLTMLGHQDKVMVVLLATLFANLVLNFALVPAFGLYGAAAATAATLTLKGLIFSRLARRVTGIETLLFRLPPSNAR